MAARIYQDKDVDLRWLRGKTCAVIGFGAQGRAHALNLRDSGMSVLVGLYPKSKSRALVRREGLPVHNTRRAVAKGDVIFVALPDTKMPAVFAREIAPALRRGQTLLFAHGFAIFYRTIIPPADVDLVMVAPKGLGPMVRREFVAGRGVPALFAVQQDVSGRAKRTALAWAKAIGCTRAGVIETNFRDETETDMFGEQAVLCGGMTALISDTAKWGELTVGPQIVDQTVRRNTERALREIRSGKFARRFIREMNSGQKSYKKLLRATNDHPIEIVGRKLRGLMQRGKMKTANRRRRTGGEQIQRLNRGRPLSDCPRLGTAGWPSSESCSTDHMVAE